MCDYVIFTMLKETVMGIGEHVTRVGWIFNVTVLYTMATITQAVPVPKYRHQNKYLFYM
jgi:DMSO reductase anchor subunit